MKKRSKFFLGLTIVLVCLALIDCFSIVFCVMNGSLVEETKQQEQIMSFVYLFIHLIALGFAVFLSLKAYLVKSTLIQVIMTQDDGSLNKRSRINAIIFMVFGFAIFITFFLALVGVFKAITFFSIGLKLALTNVGLSVGVVALFLVCYKSENSR